MMLLALLAWMSFTQNADDVWRDFAAWVEQAPAGRTSFKSMMDVYIDKLVVSGVQRDEAQRRAQLIVSEAGSGDRKRAGLYWDAIFKFDGGPDRPLPLLAETVHNLGPGSALDVSMGNGRNAVYLASLGWRTTGYDVSGIALEQARARAQKMKLNIECVQASHKSFAWAGRSWDLIVLSYIVVDKGDDAREFAQKLWTALRPGGRLVCESNYCETLIQTIIPLRLPDFRLERYSDEMDVRDWTRHGERGRVIRAVIHKLEH